jgi:transposase
MAIQKQSWEITDEFWEEVKHIIPTPKRDENKAYKRKPGAGRKPMCPRKVLEAIFYVLRTGIQWKALPKERGASSSVHRYFMYWCEEGFFLQMWQLGLEKYDEVQGIKWDWLCGDACMTKSPLSQESVGKNPTDRGKNGGKTSPCNRRQRRSSGNIDNRG